MKYSSRFFLYAPLALFLALCAIVMVHWWQVAGALDRKLDALKGRQAVPGVTLDWSKVTVSGFPFRVELMFDGLAVKGAGAHGPFAWSSERFAIHALAFGEDTAVMEAAGAQTLAWSEASGAAHAVSFQPGTLRASAVRDGRGLLRFDLDIHAAASPDFSAGRLQLHMRRDPDGKSIDLMASAEDLRRAAGIGFFGPHITRLQVYATLSNGAALAPLLRGETSAPAADAAWRQAGGGVRIAKVDVRSSNLSISLSNAGLLKPFAGLLAPLY